MRLIVRDDARQFTQQTHAYAEYRAFSGLVGHGRPVETVTVTLARRPAHGSGRVVCTIVARSASGDWAEARAMARHAYAAIDRAVSLIRAPARGSTGSPDGADRAESAPHHRERA